jgi:hypothetical protein
MDFCSCLLKTWIQPCLKSGPSKQQILYFWFNHFDGSKSLSLASNRVLNTCVFQLPVKCHSLTCGTVRSGLRCPCSNGILALFPLSVSGHHGIMNFLWAEVRDLMHRASEDPGSAHLSFQESSFLQFIMVDSDSCSKDTVFACAGSCSPSTCL